MIRRYRALSEGTQALESDLGCSVVGSVIFLTYDPGLVFASVSSAIRLQIYLFQSILSAIPMQINISDL